MTHPNVDPARLERNWTAVCAHLDAPRPSLLERLLTKAGLPSRFVRVAIATPSLRRAWFVAVVVVSVVGLIATQDGQRSDLLTLLVVAPLVPVLGVALGFGPESDPAHEVSLSTPMRGLELVLTRASTVLVGSGVVLAAVTMLQPQRSAIAFAWIVPSLALTASSLALMTWFSPRRATAVVGGGWLFAMVVVRNGSSDPLAAFSPAGQAALFAIGSVAAGLVALRRDRFDVWVASW